MRAPKVENSIIDALVRAKIDFGNLEILIPVMAVHPSYKRAKGLLETAIQGCLKLEDLKLEVPVQKKEGEKE